MAFFASYRSSAGTPVAIGLSGLLLTLVGGRGPAGAHRAPSTYFNHNALYHLLQAIALFLIFRAAIFLAPLPCRSLVPSLQSLALNSDIDVAPPSLNDIFVGASWRNTQKSPAQQALRLQVA